MCEHTSSWWRAWFAYLFKFCFCLCCHQIETLTFLNSVVVFFFLLQSGCCCCSFCFCAFGFIVSKHYHMLFIAMLATSLACVEFSNWNFHFFHLLYLIFFHSISMVHILFCIPLFSRLRNQIAPSPWLFFCLLVVQHFSFIFLLKFARCCNLNIFISFL